MDLSTAAQYIKSEIDEIIGAWGMAAILEVLADRVHSEIIDGEYKDDPQALGNAQRLHAKLKAALVMTDEGLIYDENSFD